MTSTNPVIQVKQVKKVYTMGANKVFALRGVDLTVETGEMIAIMGASGSGKSTLMNILGCLDVPTDGQYWLDGTRVDGLSKNQLADLRNAKLGFVFQGFNLLARTTAIDNVELPLLYDRTGTKKNTKELAKRALERVGLGERLDHQPSELSGGQQQRVAIARALAGRPQLLLADEPTGNLDSTSARQIMDLLARINAEEGMTIVMVTHDHEFAARAHRRLHIFDGTLIDPRAAPTLALAPARS